MQINRLQVKEFKISPIKLGDDLPDIIYLDNIVDAMEEAVREIISHDEINNIEYLFTHGAKNTISYFHRKDEGSVIILISLVPELLIQIKHCGSIENKPCIIAMIQDRMNKIMEEYNNDT